MLFDTHAHMDDPKFDEDREDIIEKCKDEGVTYIVNIGSNIATSVKSINLSKKHDFIYAAVGVHPHDSKGMDENSCAILEELAKNNDKVRAIGEIGLDYHYDYSPRDIQKKRFAEQIDLAKQIGLPVIIHNREAHEDTLRILRQSGVKDVGGVFHSYSGSVEMMREVLKLNMYISISGPVTYKNARKTVEVSREVPLDRLLIETDSPYLTPVPHRGERNYPGYVKYVAEKIAVIREVEPDEIANATLKNGRRLFGI
ncbi:MAG: TatD family hydrolase [Clostridiales bacterium]|nr:TatD family hydrolase [Clostridiales bacterium]